MIRVYLSYDWITSQTEIKIDNMNIPLNSQLNFPKNAQIDNWIDKFQENLFNVTRAEECELIFYGAQSDFNYIKSKIDTAKKPRIILSFIENKESFDYDALYSEYKGHVIEINNKFSDLISMWTKVSKSAQLPNPAENMQKDIESIKKRADDINNKKFFLFVAGESKSGKSTFINSYLKNEFLPMDDLQCTNALITIKNGAKMSVAVKYAGHKDYTSVAEGEERAKEFLKLNAAISEEWREIPVAALNIHLIAQGKKNRTMTSREIEGLFEEAEIKNANIRELEEKEYKEKVRKYISEYQGNWDKLIEHIKIYFPIPDKSLRDIEIIDSPGVYARGGVSKISENSFKNANAIIFLKHIGTALESYQFNRLFEEAKGNRIKNALFLVLTHATSKTANGVAAIEQEFNNQFSKRVSKRNIFTVDSKSELLANQFENIEDVKAKLDELKRNGDKDAFLGEAWSDTEGAENRRSAFIKELRRVSGFSNIRAALSTFGRKAHFIALNDLLNYMDELLKKTEDHLDEHIYFQETKTKKGHEELERQIKNLQSEIEDIRSKMDNEIKFIFDKYLGMEGLIKKKVHEKAENFEKEISALKVDTDFQLGKNNAFDTLRRKTENVLNEYVPFQDTLVEDIINDCNEKLMAIVESSKIKFSALKPNNNSFEELAKTFNESKSLASEITTETTGCWWWEKVERKLKHDRHKLFEQRKNAIERMIKEHKEQITNELGNYAREVIAAYRKALSENAETKRAEYNAVMLLKANNEQFMQIIEQMKSNYEDIRNTRKQISETKGEISNYAR